MGNRLRQYARLPIAGYYDWELSYDNWVHCRLGMPSYCPWEAPDKGLGSVLISRAAGPDAPLEGKAALSDYDDADTNRPSPKVMALWIDSRFKDTLEKTNEGDFLLTAAQIRALLAAARKDRVVEFVGDTKSFTLSGKGISAVLLKADAAQGRVGTPGALIKKGNRSEQSVFPPRAKPVIRAAKVSDAPSRHLTAPEIAALKPVLLQGMEDKCWGREQEYAEQEEVFALTPLDERHVLISRLCWRAAYNEGYAYWVTDSALKNPPKLVTHVGNEYYVENDSGRIDALHKGRGLGDCWNGAGWVWDGKAFRLSSQWISGKCRLIHAGGAWRLPTFVAHIVNAAAGKP